MIAKTRRPWYNSAEICILFAELYGPS